MMAVSLVAMLPCLIIFLLVQRYFIQGVVLTGIKG
jgi:ABC-type glycerol-3-phosphate transport system permease component